MAENKQPSSNHQTNNLQGEGEKEKTHEEKLQELYDQVVYRAKTYRNFHLEHLPKKKRGKILQQPTRELLEEALKLSEKNKYRRTILTECVLREYSKFIVEIYHQGREGSDEPQQKEGGEG